MLRDEFSNIQDQQNTSNHNYENELEQEKYIQLLDHLNILLSLSGAEKTILRNLETELTYYARENLNRVGSSNYFTRDETNVGYTTQIAKKKKTKEERAKATNLLFDMIKSSSTSEVYQYVNTPYFKEMIGAREIKLNWTRVHLADVINKFNADYKRFLSFNNKEYLQEILHNEDIYKSLPNNQKAKLFWYCDPKIVANAIVNIHQDRNFKHTGHPRDTDYLDYELLEKLLNNESAAIEYVDEVRSVIKAPLLFKTDARSPGKNQIADEGLDRYELFQYDEYTIIAVEQYIREKYGHLLINKLSNINYPKSSIAPYYFYQISAVQYMLLDPENTNQANYFRYLSFKKDLRSLVASYDVNHLQKPIILLGLINIDGNHYLPYFIHKNQHNKIQIITVDPSPKIYPENKLKDGSHEDAKWKTRLKLIKTFQDIFPKCEFTDPNVSQMLRERDCGPNAATTIVDALESAETDSPLLLIIDDQLTIQSDRLTIHYQPIGMNPYLGTYVYPAQLEADSLSNREVWKNRLVEIKEIRTMVERSNLQNRAETGLSVRDEYDMNKQLNLEFNYIKQVETQEHQDLTETNISAIQSLLFSHPEGRILINKLITEYKKNLILPDSRELVRFIKSKISSEAEINTLTSTHSYSLAALANDVIAVLLREYIPAALESVFKAKILNRLPFQTGLNPDKIVENFLEQNTDTYSKLNLYQQRLVRCQLLTSATHKIEEINIQIYSDVVAGVLARNCRKYLANIQGKYKKRVTANRLIHFMQLSGTDSKFASKKIKKAINYLKIHDRQNLNELMNKHITHVLDSVIEPSVEKLVQKLQIESLDFNQILHFISKETGEFIPYNEENLIALLNKYNFYENGNIITTIEVKSIIGTLVLEDLNELIFNKLNQRIDACIQNNIDNFLRNPAVLNEFITNETISTLESMLDCHGNIIPRTLSDEKLSKLFEKYGSLNFITDEQFANKHVKKLAISYLRNGLEQVINSALNEHYNDFARKILYVNSYSLFIKNMYTYMGKSTDIIAREFYTVFLINASIEDRNYFLENFTDLEYPNLYTFHYLYNAEYQIPFNDHGLRFHQWFSMNKLNQLFLNLNHVNSSCININNIKVLLKNLFDIFKNNSPLCDLITKNLQLLEKTQENSNQLSMINSFTEEFNQLNENLLENIQKLLKKIFSDCYKLGETTPESLTVKLRPIFYSLYNIETPCLMTKKQLIKFDGIITQKINDKNAINNISPKSNLLSLTNVTQLADTYGMQPTRDLLIKCVSYWYSHSSTINNIPSIGNWFSHEPELIKRLIEIINNNEDDDNQKIIEELNDIDYLVKDIGSYNKVNIYVSTDKLDIIRAALLRTRAFTDNNETPLKFSTIAKFISLKEANINHKSDNNNHINISNKIPVMKKSEEYTSLLSINVQSKELRRSLLPALSIFGNDLTNLEQRLLIMQKKHNKNDFNFDEDDIKTLVIELKYNWENVLKHHEENPASYYLHEPCRKAKLYIAFADIISSYYRSKDIMVFPHELLMPGFYRYPPQADIRFFTIPNSICNQFNLEPDSSIADIPLNNLVITRTGYPLDIDWIINIYERSGKLINPYTSKDLSKDELDDILLNEKTSTIITAIQKKSCTFVSEKAINYLVEYLNNAIFSSGFKNIYNNEEDNEAAKAYEILRHNLHYLPSLEKKGILNEYIPHEPMKTVEQILHESKDLCLTLKGVSLARVVIAYKGNHHGLKNETLVARALEKQITPRTYNLSNGNFSLVDLNTNERYLFNKYKKAAINNNILKLFV